MVDLIHDGEVSRAAVRAAGHPDDAAVEAGIRGRQPTLPPWLLADVPQWRRIPRYQPRMDDETLRRMATDSADLAFLRRLAPRSSVAIPLLARNRRLGSLTMVTTWSGRRYSPEDVRFLQVLAGRVALVLDNAGIFSDLEGVERRMDAVMGMIDAGVLVRDAQGRIVYANDAAAGWFGLDRARRLLDLPPESLTGLHTAASSDGVPLRPGSDPLVAPLTGGRITERRLVRVVPAGGSERWARVSSQAIRSPAGEALYTVTTVDDVTAVKRAEAAQAELAATLQRELLPPRLPQMPAWALAAMYRPAGEISEVGGDFYDVFELAAGRMVVVGDVVGRGPAAASLTSLARYTLRTASALVPDPAVALRTLNDMILDRPDALCSVAVVLLPHGDPGQTGGEVTVLCAGHPPPLLVRGGRVEQLALGGPMLGATVEPRWEPQRTSLAEGDLLVVHTDGVTDAVGEPGRFGERRLRETLAGVTDARMAVERVERALDLFVGDRHADDAAALAIQRVRSRVSSKRSPAGTIAGGD
jgi:PAS domain-containing protein